jgi:hypothetical protein
VKAVTIVPIGTDDGDHHPIVPIVTCPRGLFLPVASPPTPWSVPDWWAFHDERLAIRQHDGGMQEQEAAHWAWLDCVAKWMERHPPIDAALRAWTGTPGELRLARIADAEVCVERLGLARTG